jgi:hypothetical protein
MQKLNPQKPGISQPERPPAPPKPAEPERGGSSSTTPPADPDGKDKSRQVPIEGE